MTTRLQSACVHHHTLVHIVGDYWACECPAVYERHRTLWLDPARKGLVEEIVRIADRQGGIRALARQLEQQYQDEQAEKKRDKRAERKKKRAMA